MDLPQPSIPHQMADSGAGRVARRTEVRAPSQNRELATLLRQARRSNIQQYHRDTLRRAYSTQNRIKYGEYNDEPFRQSVRKSGSHNSIESSELSEPDSTDNLNHQKWASSGDIYRAYSHSTPLQTRKVNQRAHNRRSMPANQSRMKRESDEIVCIDLRESTPRTLSLDRGLNELDTLPTNLHPNPRPYRSTQTSKRTVKTSFSVPLQTLHEQHEEQEFGFAKIKLASQQSAKPRQPLKESNSTKKSAKRKEVRKIDISAPIPIENQPPIAMRSLNLKMAAVGEAAVNNSKPAQVSTIKINMQPVKRSKSFAHKVKFWTLKLSMKDKIAREMNDQTYKEDEYCKIH